MTCLFCQHTSLHSRLVKMGEHTLVFLADPKLVSGHLLITPKRHVEQLIQLTPEESQELFTLLTEYEHRITNQIASRCDIRYQDLSSPEETVTRHLAFSLLPREPYDELYDKVQINEKKLFQSLTRGETTTYKELLSS